MIRTKKAKKILTKAEQKHLTQSGINSIAAMKRQIDFMDKEIKEKGIENCFPCLECMHIANKLDL